MGNNQSAERAEESPPSHSSPSPKSDSSSPSSPSPDSDSDSDSSSSSPEQGGNTQDVSSSEGTLTKRASPELIEVVEKLEMVDTACGAFMQELNECKESDEECKKKAQARLLLCSGMVLCGEVTQEWEKKVASREPTEEDHAEHLSEIQNCLQQFDQHAADVLKRENN